MATASKKFIPNGDLDFSEMAWRFAQGIAGDPRKFRTTQEDAAAVTEAVNHFRGALRQARPGGRRSGSMADTAAKDAARQEAERIIRRLAGAIRSNPEISAAHKALLGIKAASAKRGRAGAARGASGGQVPGESPVLVFKQAIHRSVHVPEHELTFRGRSCPGKPTGAARLELFVELVPPEAAVPERPGGSTSGGGAGVHYLRSYVRSPIRLVPPMADRAMRVVYWGRWADASGNVGPFSAAAAGWVEGGSHHLMGPALPGGGQGFSGVSATTSLVERLLPRAEDTAGESRESGGPGGPGGPGEPGVEQRTRVMIAVMQTQQRFLESSGGLRDGADDQGGGGEPQRLDAA